MDKRVINIKNKVVKKIKTKPMYKTFDYNKIHDSLDKLIDINYLSQFDDGHLDLYFPKGNKKNLPLVIWIHGGAYIAGDKERPRPFCERLASKGYIVANIDYLLAPVGVYPMPIIQVYEALSYLKDHCDDYNIDFNNIFIGGDSAGAQIASQIGAMESNPVLLKKMGFDKFFGENLRGLILFCGLYNMNTVLNSGFPGIKWYMDIYTNSNFSHFYKKNELSTIENITNLYPHTFITCGKRDPFYNQAKELIINFKRYNIEYTFVSSSGGHECQFNMLLKSSMTTFDELIIFIESNLNLTK